jgi:hypothetical protein
VTESGRPTPPSASFTSNPAELNILPPGHADRVEFLGG